ncbi:hypothetical protein Tco_0139978 [Tanacetum coccineum]
MRDHHHQFCAGPEEQSRLPILSLSTYHLFRSLSTRSFTVDDEVLFPAEEQPLLTADSPIIQSPGFIPESDPEGGSRGGCRGGSVEDPADYLLTCGDDDDAVDEQLLGADTCPLPRKLLRGVLVLPTPPPSTSLFLIHHTSLSTITYTPTIRPDMVDRISGDPELLGFDERCTYLLVFYGGLRC